jgi:hypothetical protein
MNTLEQLAKTLKEQLSAEWQKQKKSNISENNPTKLSRDYDKIKVLHADLKDTKAKLKALSGKITIAAPSTSEQNQAFQKKARARVDKRRAKKGIVIERSTYVPKWKK